MLTTKDGKLKRYQVMSELLKIIQYNWERRGTNPEELLHDLISHPNIAIVERNGNNINELSPILNSDGNIEMLPFSFNHCNKI